MKGKRVNNWEFCEDFLRGQWDFIKGKKPEENASEYYMRGYRTEQTDKENHQRGKDER